MQPFDIPNAGRAAMIADPQGIPFYVMRGSTDGASTAFERTGMGKCKPHRRHDEAKRQAAEGVDVLLPRPRHRRGRGG